jgi:hypothetical protein
LGCEQLTEEQRQQQRQRHTQQVALR